MRSGYLGAGALLVLAMNLSLAATGVWRWHTVSFALSALTALLVALSILLGPRA